MGREEVAVKGEGGMSTTTRIVEGVSGAAITTTPSDTIQGPGPLPASHPIIAVMTGQEAAGQTNTSPLNIWIEVVPGVAG